MARFLADLFTEEEKARFDEMYRRNAITDSSATLFAERFASEVDDIEYRLRENDRVSQQPWSPQLASSPEAFAAFLDKQRQELMDRRSRAFDTALDASFGTRSWAQLKNLDRAVMTGYAGERFQEYLKEQGPLGVGKDLARSLITSIPRGLEATYKTATGGFGERPIERIGEMAGIIPVTRGTAGLAATLARAGGKARLARQLGRAVSNPAARGVSYTAEAADILGAEEDVYSEALLEILGEGTTEATGAIGRGAKGDLSPQEQRKLDNDNAAAERAARVHAGRINAALDADALLFTQLTQQIAARKTELTPEEVANISDELFVATFENQIAPQIQGEIDALGELGLQNAGDVLRARMLELHQSTRPQEETDATTATELTGDDDTAQQAGTDTVDTEQTPEQTATQTPEETQETPDETPQEEEVELTPEEIEAQAEQEAAAIVANATRPNTYFIENALEGLSEPVDAETFLSMFGDDMPQAYRDNPRAMDMLLNQLVEDEDTRVMGADPTEAGVRQYTAEVAANEVPEARVGTETIGFHSDNVTEQRVRPVLRELDELVPSHQLDGEKRADYPEDLQPREGRGGMISMDQVRNTASNPNFVFLLEFPKQFRDGPPLTSKRFPRRVVSGNGRTLALQLMQQNYPENWQGYQEALRAELEKVGIDPAEADAMQNPVLTYELMDSTDEVEVARDANVQTQLEHTATEQAGQDADYFDDDLMALWQPGEGSFEEILKSEGNQAFRTALFSRIPTHLVAGLMTADNANFSADGIKRIQNAMIRYVFGGEIGERLSQIFIETGIEDLKSIDTMLRNIVATLAYAKANGQNIGPELASAIFRYIEFDGQSDSEARTRRVPKETLVYAKIDALYKTGGLIDAPTLLEKQLLYLIYAKRSAPRQLADDFQAWAERAVEIDEQGGLFGGETATPTAATSEAVFAGIIRDYINATVFETRETQDGRIELLPPDSMPTELVNLREDMDKIPTTEGKQQFVSDWIDIFLSEMNEGETQQEATDATETTDTSTGESTPGVRGTTPADTSIPPGTGRDASQGGTTPTDTGATETPESQSGVDTAQSGGTPRDERRGTQGDATSVQTDDRRDAVDDGLGPRFSEMSAEEILDYVRSENVVYVNRSRDGEWANFRVGQDYDDGAGIGTGVTVQLRTPQNGTVRAALIVIDRNNEVITGFERDIASTSAKVATARAFIEGLTRDDIQTALGSETTPTGEVVTKAEVESITGKAVDDAAIRDINEILDREENLSYWHLSSITLTHDDAGSPVRMTQAQAEQIIALAKPDQTLSNRAGDLARDPAGFVEALLEGLPLDTDIEALIATEITPLLEPLLELNQVDARTKIAQAEGHARNLWRARQSRAEQQETETPPETDIEEALAIASVGTVSIDEWNAADPAGKRTFLQRQEQAIPVHLRNGVINIVEADQKRKAIDLLRRNITQETPDADDTTGDPADTETTPQRTDEGVEPLVDAETQQQPSSGAGMPTDTNQLVGVSRRQDAQETSDVSPVVQSALNRLGITVEAWQAAVADGTAIDILNSFATDVDNVDAVTDLHASLDDRADATPEEMGFEDEEEIDDDFFSDVQPKPNRLHDITDEQRSDFDMIRRKLFLARTIARLEAKTDRTLEETLQLRALQATQRTDAQQDIYEDLLRQFIDRRVARLQAKSDRSATENRILETLTAVQAEGNLPVEASELSLYSDLETPDQEHSRPLAETRTLAGVQAPDTSETALNLPETVTADTTQLSPAQLTSVKAIVSAFTRKIHTTTDTTVQGGFLLADKMGVGKTRQALATIWHYMRSGIQKHFVLAPNTQILNNYTTDFEKMGGPSNDISHYDSGNQQLSTSIGTATYNMIIRKPSLHGFNTTTGNQNAIADIIEHLTGARPTFQQTHPRAHQAAREDFERIGIHNLPGNTAEAVLDNAVTELRNQAKRVNLKNAQAVDQFRQRVTPELADMLLDERRGSGTQLRLGGGSNLHDVVAKLLAFAQTHLGAQPDPNFAEAAENFEGVIVLDEMHKAAGRNQTGQMIDILTNLLPNAKFLYMSATPFKEIDNFAVASRLGLWGANQAFPSFSRFAHAFRRATRAVKEVIPLHLKQIGRYVSRALSARETRYTPVEVPLTDTEKRQYDTAVQLVQNIRLRFEASIDEVLRTSWGSLIESEGQFHQYRAKYMRMFYGATQDFFLALLDSMKAQGLQNQIQEQLQNGDKIIVQLENTWEATVERARQRGDTGTIGPFNLLIDFVENENLFPVHVHHTEVRRKNDGTDYTVVVPQMEYRDGEEVRSVDPRLKRLQQLTLETLQREMNQSVFSKGLPFAADIIHTAAIEAGLGLGASGEISGRSQIYPRDNPQAMPQDTESRKARSKAFSETTDLNLIVLGPAGLTGINLPVTEQIKNKVGALYHYLVQSSWNVNTFEQGLGRGKRSDSAIDPHYIIAHQDLPGADRVLGATLAKFAEMGALAGQADNALMQNIDKAEGQVKLEDDPEADDMSGVFEENEGGERSHIFGIHGQEALEQLWSEIYHSGDMTIPDTLGLAHPEIAGDTGFIDPTTVPSVQRFFQRLLHQPTAAQPGIYTEFESRLKRIIAYRRELGELDVGANDLNSTDGQIQDRLTIYTDPDTGQTAEMVKLTVKRKLPRRSWEFLSKVIRQEPGYEQHGRDFHGIYTDADGYVWAMFGAPSRPGQSEREYVRWGPRGTPVAGLHKGENRVTDIQLTEDFTPVAMESNQRLLDIEAAQRLWEAQDADTDTHVDSELYMATGMVLPKWTDLGTGRYNYPIMGIIPMIDGSHLHGRVIPPAAVSGVLRQIGGVDPNYFDPSGRTEAPALPDDPEINIPELVREIVGEATDPQIRARLEGIVEHIHQKLPLKLRGHLVRSAQEAALLGQLIRDPQVEHVWIVYRREGRIVKIEPMSLNRKGEADAGDFEHIKAEAGRLQADAVLRIHNHPSGVAKWSQPDKNVAMQWHHALGTLMAEDIIVDSGTFAYRTFENGQYTWHEDVALNPQAADWDTGVTSVKSDVGEQKATDPLYQNPLIRGAREAAAYMWGLKRDMNAVELVFVDPQTGKITDTITDTQIQTSQNGDEAIARLKSLMAERPGQHVHVMTWGDPDIGDMLATLLINIDVEGVDSVWHGAQRLTGKDHVKTAQDQTVTDNRTEDDKQTDALLEHVLSQTITDPEASVDIETNLEAPQAAHTVRSDQVKRGLEGFNERYKQEKRKRGSRWTPKQKVQEARISEDRTILVKLDKNDQWTPIVRTIDGKDYYVTPYTLQGPKWKIAEHIVNWRGGTKKGTYLSLLARGELQSTAEDLATGDIRSSRNAAGWDALTDNKNYIFLAPSDKSYRQINLGKALGFFFDAEWLIRNGATVGTQDSIEFYDRIIKNVLSKAFYPAYIGRRAAFTRGRVRREDILAYIRNDTEHLKGKDDKDMAAIQQAYQDIQKQLPKVSQQFRFTGDKALQLLRQGRAREILVPNRLSHDGLLGIIEDSKHFQLVEPTSAEPKTPGILKQITNRIKGVFSDVTTEQKGDNILSDYQPSAETEHAGTVARAMPTLDQMLMTGKQNARGIPFVNPQTELFNKMRMWTPKLRKGARVLANAVRSGYGLLEELKAPPDADAPAPGNIIEDILDQRMYVSQAYQGRTRSLLGPILKQLDEQVKSEDRENADPRRATVDHDIINFIEYNTPIPDRSKSYQSIATELKETWRKVNQSFVEAWITLMRDLGHREEITKFGSSGRQRWSPEPMRMGNTTLVWSWDVKDPDGADGAFATKETLAAIQASKQKHPQQGTLNIDEGFKTYTIAEAFAAADGLWYPHQYDRSRLRDYNRKIEALVKALNQLAAEGDQASEDAFKAAGITKVDGGYQHNRVDIVFPDLDAVIKFYTETRDRTATLIQMYDNGTIGFYPHLERVRETHDRLYRRDTNLLMSTAALLWDRFAEVAMFGQIDPYGKLPPRLATMLQTVEHYNTNDREAALMAVINGLQEAHRSEESLAEDDRHWGMHESIPAFERGERAAFDIMQMWEDYYIDDDGNKVKTGKWKGIDINRLNLDQKTLETLKKIGFIQSDGEGGWKVYGKTDAAQQKTIARFFVELMQTKQNRRNTVERLVQGLGHWQQKAPLDQESDQLWKRFNTLITAAALGPKQALQNLTEIPTLEMVVGMKSFAGMMQLIRTDPNFRDAAEELTKGLKQGVEFLSDDNLQERYLNSWFSMFGRTEAYSRMLGVGAGLVHAKNLTLDLINSAEGSKKRAAIVREMRTLRLNPDTLLSLTPSQVEPMFQEVVAKIKDGTLLLGGLDLPSAPRTETDTIGDEWARSAMYVSDMIFKPYDARTLPAQFQKDSAFARLFLKFKGWMLQQNRFMYDQYKRAGREMQQGNFTPIARMLAGTAMLTGTVAIPQAFFAALQGRDDEDDRLLRAFLHTQTLGLTAIGLEMALRSEGNPWRLEKTLEGTFVGPVFGTFADILSPAATGDWDRSLQEVLQRTPVAREALSLGGNRFWEDEE